MNSKRIVASIMATSILMAAGGTAALADTPMLISAPDEVMVDMPIASAPSYVGAEMTISEVAEGYIMAKKGDEVIQLNTSMSTVVIDNQTGEALELSSLAEGDTVYVYHSEAMTFSIPAQTSAFAIVANLVEGETVAKYHTAEEVTVYEDGSAAVLTDNGSILVTVGGATNLTLLGSDNVVPKPFHITEGTTFFAWYDIVTLSLPGQAYAQKAVMLPMEESGELPYSGSYIMSTSGEVTALNEGEIEVKTDIGSATFLTENAFAADNESGIPSMLSDIAVGDYIYVYHAPVHMGDSPTVYNAKVILTNVESMAMHYVTAEDVSYGEDGTVTVTAMNGDFEIAIGADLAISPFMTRQIVTNKDIFMGTDLLIRYAEDGMTVESVVIMPASNYDFTIVREGDIAIAEGMVQNGVAMVPLRVVAESLGYTVTWNAEDASVTLEGDKNSSTVKIGDNMYSSVVTGEVADTQSLGGTAFISEEGISYVPAAYFNMLGYALTLNGTTLFM